MVKLRILSKYIYIFYAQRRTKVTVIVKWNETHHVLAQFDAFILKGTFGYFSYQFIIRIYINMNIQAEQFNGWIFAQTHIFFFHPDLYNRSLRNRQLRAAIFKTYSEPLLPCHMINLNHLYGFFLFFFLGPSIACVVWWRGGQVLPHITRGAVPVLKTEENSTAPEEMPYTFTAVWALLPKVGFADYYLLHKFLIICGSDWYSDVLWFDAACLIFVFFYTRFPRIHVEMMVINKIILINPEINNEPLRNSNLVN